MPVILPHKLLPWLIRTGRFPDVSVSDIRQYWQHHKCWNSGIEAPANSTGHHVHPLWIWGDDCRYGKKINQKIMVCSMGHVLDGNRDSYSSCFPLWVCGCDPRSCILVPLLMYFLRVYNVYHAVYYPNKGPST